MMEVVFISKFFKNKSQMVIKRGLLNLILFKKYQKGK